jgi:hypothetical protein
VYPYQVYIVMNRADGSEIYGRAVRANGKTTRIRSPDGKSSLDEVQHVRVMGRQDPTAAERACKEFLLLLLRGERKLQDTNYIRLLWFPSKLDLARFPLDEANLLLPTTADDLNQSQRRVVMDMVQTRNPAVIAHGQIHSPCSCFPSHILRPIYQVRLVRESLADAFQLR